MAEVREEAVENKEGQNTGVKPHIMNYVDVSKYRVREGEEVDLDNYSTCLDQKVDKESAKMNDFPLLLKELSLLQAKLYAQSSYGLIIVLQAMDAAGKDGTIRHVFSHLDPNGVRTVSFKQPTTEEEAHDYMWRINRALPRRGEIGIFNRSQYEDVIVTRVHQLLEKSNIPPNLVDKDIWKRRYRQINDWEQYLYENGFPMVKIFLHVSKDEQRDRLAERILNKKKNWKFSMADINERRYWDQYQDLYGEMISQTSRKHSPWYIVPADNKWYTRYVVAKIVIRELERIAPEFPKMSKEIKDQLETFRQLIENGQVGLIQEMESMITDK
jgi:PPK2 family polyphosphate:nucleotide phosphotransferase